MNRLPVAPPASPLSLPLSLPLSHSWRRRAAVMAAVVAASIAISSPAPAQQVHAGHVTDLGIAIGMAEPVGSRLRSRQVFTPDGPAGGVDVAGGARRGFSAMLSIGTRWEGSPFGVRVEAQYSRFGLEPDPRHGPGGAPETADGRVTSLSGTANVLVAMPGARTIRPYVVAGAGAYRITSDIVQEPNSSYPGRGVTRFGLNGGGGVEVAMGPVTAFAEARYHHALNGGGAVRYLPVVIGARF